MMHLIKKPKLKLSIKEKVLWDFFLSTYLFVCFREDNYDEACKTFRENMEAYMFNTVTSVEIKKIFLFLISVESCVQVSAPARMLHTLNSL